MSTEHGHAGSHAGRHDGIVADAATRAALERLAQSRWQLARWVEVRALAREISAVGGFRPRSATMRTLMSMGGQLPWARWAFSAFMLWRSLRRRRRR